VEPLLSDRQRIIHVASAITVIDAFIVETAPVPRKAAAPDGARAASIEHEAPSGATQVPARRAPGA
jgi:hypothetical protein